MYVHGLICPSDLHIQADLTARLCDSLCSVVAANTGSGHKREICIGGQSPIDLQLLLTRVVLVYERKS